MVSLLTLLRHFARTHKGKARPRRLGLGTPRCRLLVERLEGRCLPSTVITEFGGLTPNSFPTGITLGPDGNLWFTEYTSSKIGRLNLATGVVSEFSTPTADSEPTGITAGPDGNLWFTEQTQGVDKIGRITPAGLITAADEFAIPTPRCQADSITAGPDGNLWFTEVNTSKIGRITTAGVITAADEFTTPTPSSVPVGITAGPDGNLWFTEDGASKIGRITTAGVITAADEFATPTPKSGPLNITAGPDGNLWFTEVAGNKIGRITTAGAITANDEFTVPTANSFVLGITAGADGNLWFTEQMGKIGEITTSGFFAAEMSVPTSGGHPDVITAGPNGTLAFTEGSGNKIGVVHALPPTGIREFGGITPRSLPLGITLGPDGNLWFTEPDADEIGRLNMATGDLAEFATPTAGGQPFGITAGPDGNLWFTESIGNKIGRITTAGVITAADEFPIPTANFPLGITAGPDGNLWFTDGDRIDRITTAGVITGADEFSIPSFSAQRITAGPDGNLWFTEDNANKIGRITTSGVTTEFAIPTANSGPKGITAGPDGNLWFTESQVDKIGRMTTAGTMTASDEFTVPTPNSFPLEITAGPDGNLWFAEDVGKIGEITTSGHVVAEFEVPTGGSRPEGITAGPQSTVVFTESDGNKVGVVHDVPAADHPPPVQLGPFANTITHSKEHYAQFVTNAYQQYLARKPDDAGLSSWVNQMQSGLTDEQLEAGFIGSAEYIANHGGSGAGWVQGLYHDILGRTPAQSEVNYWVSQLQNGVLPQTVALAFAAGSEREANRVRADYLTFLGRPPAQAEVTSWVNSFANGLSNEGLVAGFLGSSEYYNNAGKGKGDNLDWIKSATQDVLARAPSADEIANALTALTPKNLGAVAGQITHSIEHYFPFVTSAYQQYLGRIPDETGLDAWVSKMQAGLTDERLEAQFIGSAEYIAKHGGAGAGWVQGLYHDILGRTPAQSEVDFWVSQLQSGVLPQTIALGIAASREREGNRVRSDYQTFLGRIPAQSEVDFWVSRFAQGLTNEDLAAGFLGSIEYFNAAGKGRSDKADWVLSAVIDELQRSPTIDELNTLQGMLQ